MNTQLQNSQAQNNLLQLSSSLFGQHGQSSQLADAFVAQWRAAHPNGAVTTRDLAAQPVPHLTAERFQGFLAAPEARTDAQHAAVAESDALIGELQRADTIVIGLPMYNFGVPSTLKAYFDHIARANVTFSYTATGPKGLLTGKRAYVFATRGGAYAGTPLDTQTSYVRDFLRFVGITDVDFIYAEGLAMGDDSRNTALAAAKQRIAEFHETALAA
jgi:FMN-dependent NADH-azoreductase